MDNWLLGIVGSLVVMGITATVKIGYEVAKLQQWKEGHERLMQLKMDALHAQVDDVKKLLIIALSGGKKNAKLDAEDLVETTK